MTSSAAPALVIIDVQKAIDDPRWALHGPRNNLETERNIELLLGSWRTLGWPIYHVRHDSLEADSAYRRCQPGNDFKPEAAPRAGEMVIVKHSNSAFIGTDFEARLRQARQRMLVVCGVITNNSVEATVRMAGNLGFETYLVDDACFTFARPDWEGRLRTAEEVHAMSLANMDGEYATVLSTAKVLMRFPPLIAPRTNPE